MQEVALIALALERFLDTYEATEKIKLKLTSDHMTLVVKMHRDKQSLKLRLHENTLDMIKENKSKGLKTLKSNFFCIWGWNLEKVDKIVDLWHQVDSNRREMHTLRCYSKYKFLGIDIV